MTATSKRRAAIRLNPLRREVGEIDCWSFTFRVTVDLTATRKTVVREFAKAMRLFPFPYRSIDKRLREAVDIYDPGTISYREASVRVFGHPGKKDAIRTLYYKRSQWPDYA